MRSFRLHIFLQIFWNWNITINLTSGNKRVFKFFNSFGRKKFTFFFFSYHKSNLLLIALKAMRLLVNHQFERSCHERSQAIVVTSLYCLFFSNVKKQRLKSDIERCYKCSVNIKISLDPKVCFSLVTYKISNFTARHSTNQITKISAPWLLFELSDHVKQNSNRKQRTKINATYSSWEEILFGVPQVSILGALLFNFFFCVIGKWRNWLCKFYRW